MVKVKVEAKIKKCRQAQGFNHPMVKVKGYDLQAT